MRCMLCPAHLNYFIRGDEHGIQKNHPQPGFRRYRHGHLPGTKPQHQAHGAAQQRHQLGARGLHPAQPLHRWHQRRRRPRLTMFIK
jgi:hypothetical protein